MEKFGWQSWATKGMKKIYGNKKCTVFLSWLFLRSLFVDATIGPKLQNLICVNHLISDGPVAFPLLLGSRSRTTLAFDRTPPSWAIPKCLGKRNFESRGKWQVETHHDNQSKGWWMLMVFQPSWTQKKMLIGIIIAAGMESQQFRFQTPRSPVSSQGAQTQQEYKAE